MSSTVVPRYISRLKAAQMKTAAFLLGMPTSGRKSDLADILSRRLEAPPAQSEFSRVLSIDMGIRNLGVCVIEAPTLSPETDNACPNELCLSVSSWQRFDVLAEFKMKAGVQEMDSDYTPYERQSMSTIGRRSKTKEAARDILPADFMPPALCETAYKLSTSLITRYQPTNILIEHQRSRTASSRNVLQWTYRVNMLESMLWACFHTLIAQHSSREIPQTSSFAESMRALEAVREVSPAKVARFWCGHTDQDMQSVLGTFGVHRNPSSWDPDALHVSSATAKKAKIAVARRWVDQWRGDAVDEAKAHERLDFQGGAAETANAFYSTPGKRRTKKGEETVEPIGKLDDLADCLLQGVAWMKWEHNRRKFANMVAKG